MRGFGELMMWEAKVVSASNQVHACFQHIQAMNGMPTFARQRSETLTHGPIEALDQGGIELCASYGHREQLLRVLHGSPCQPAGDFHHPFLLGVLDHGGDTEVRPDL